MGNDLTNMLANAAANRRGTATAAPATTPAAAPATAPAAPKTSRREVVPAAPGVPFSVPVETIAFNPFNRRVIDLTDEETAREIKELSASLKKGQISPIVVISRAAWDAEYGTEHADKIGDAEWVQIPGGRRLTAAREHGPKTLEIVVKDSMANRETMLAMTAIENLQRLDLSPLEEAEQIEDLRQAVGGKASTVANRLSRPASYVSQRLDLLRLCAPLRDELRAGTMTLQEAARLIVQIKARITETTGVKRPEPGVTIPDAEQIEMWEAFKAARDGKPVPADQGDQGDQDADQGDQDADQGDAPTPAPRTAAERLFDVLAKHDDATLIEALRMRLSSDAARAALAAALTADDADQDDADQPDDFADADATSENEGN